MAHHEDFDIGDVYKEEWVQKGVRSIQQYLQQNAEWIGFEAGKARKVLDYACGDGAVTRALAPRYPACTFQGIDSSSKQAERFNAAVRDLDGVSERRVYAVVGDLQDPSAEIKQREWFDFDIAIMSMALHHVSDPIDMLTRLRERLKKGGIILVVEWASESDFEQSTQTTTSSGGEVHSRERKGDIDASLTVSKYDPANMIEVIGGQKIWPGFTGSATKEAMTAAGCRDVEVRVHPEEFRVPEHAGGHWGLKRLLFAKGVVA